MLKIYSVYAIITFVDNINIVSLDFLLAILDSRISSVMLNRFGNM